MRACCAVAEATGWLNALKHRDNCEDSDCPCWPDKKEEEHYEEPTPIKIELPSIDLEDVPIGTNVMKGTK